LAGKKRKEGNWERGAGETARIEEVLRYLLPTKFKSLKNRAVPDIWANC
jgi:alpha/beta superfamily hydrolase